MPYTIPRLRPPWPEGFLSRFLRTTLHNPFYTMRFNLTRAMAVRSLSPSACAAVALIPGYDGTARFPNTRGAHTVSFSLGTTISGFHSPYSVTHILGLKKVPHFRPSDPGLADHTLMAGTK